MAVRIGKRAPEFEAEAWTRGAHGPKKVGLSQHRGKWVVLFFYPRDFTFICPTEIASFGALRAKTNVELLAMSWDDFRKVIESSEASRKDFADIMRERLAQT